MPKGDRGGADPNPNGGRGNLGWDNSPNPYQIPATLDDAIGTQSSPQSMVNAYWNVNPYYSDNYREFSENCQRCVFAYELNRRGYDVEALPTYENDTMPTGGWRQALSNMSGDSVGRSTVNATIRQMERQMAQYGDGSRAIVALQWGGKGNGGHVFNVEYKDGHLYAFEPQNNRSLTGRALLKDYLHYTRLNTVELYRTDDKDITDNMRYMVKKRGS